MGLERMARVMQGVQTNFDIDIFRPIIKSLEEIAHIKYNGQSEHATLMRRIADHVKACVFCISDGVLPGNEGRGYVERRLLRRAIRDGTQLGIEGCFYTNWCRLSAMSCRNTIPILSSAGKTLREL